MKDEPAYADERTWFHTVSSDDDFDMLTTVRAWAKLECPFTSPPAARKMEGWIVGLKS